MYRTDFWTLWEKARVVCSEKKTLKHVYYQGWNRSPAQFGCMRQVLGAGALGGPRGMGWGIHVNPWLIHVSVWQKPLQYCKVISLQLIKINEEKNIPMITLKCRILPIELHSSCIIFSDWISSVPCVNISLNLVFLFFLLLLVLTLLLCCSVCLCVCKCHLLYIYVLYMFLFCLLKTLATFPYFNTFLYFFLMYFSNVFSNVFFLMYFWCIFSNIYNGVSFHSGHFNLGSILLHEFIIYLSDIQVVSI